MAGAVAHSLLGNCADNETLLLTIVAEGWFRFWLLLRGGRDVGEATEDLGSPRPLDVLV